MVEPSPDPRGHGRAVDPLALEDVEGALVGARFAAYLPSRMAPQSRLVQASVEDLDLVRADNLARAAAATGVEAIVYDAGTGDEVVRALRSTGVPVRVGTAGSDHGAVVAIGEPPDTGSTRARSTVLSIQRMTLPPGRDARWAAGEYARWCARTMRSLTVIVDADGTVRLRLRGLGTQMLVLAPFHDTPDRFVYRIAGGQLARADQAGTFEFREVLRDGTLLTIVREFEPSLPWWIYRATEALLHVRIMRAFGRAIATP